VSIARLSTQLQLRNQQLADCQASLRQLQHIKEHYVQLQAKFREKSEQLNAKEQLLDEANASLMNEFELVSAKLFDARHEQFTSSSQRQIDAVLAPFKQQLSTLYEHINDLYSKENAQRHQLIGQIAELQKHTGRISDDANNLAAALKGDNKVQGHWGELVLERLLEQSGLQKGREYRTQSSHKNPEGKRYRPDVIIHLPEQKDIIVDSKVALVEFERYTRADSENQRRQHLNAHLAALRAHVKGLSSKAYERLEGVRTLDFVLMFIPVEMAFHAAIQAAPGLFKEAQDQNVLMVSPASLMVALRTVEAMWRNDKQNANAELIANSAGSLYDQCVLVLAAIEELGGHLDKAHESYRRVQKRLTQGNGNLIKRIDTLQKLGARTTRQLPPDTVANLGTDDDN
jgi:DNA recombination protein RmuC